MTQTALIARLKKVEESLAMDDHFLRNILHYGVEDAMVAAGVAALTDLRDLIREADGKDSVGTLKVEYFRGSKGMTNTYFDYAGNLPEGDYRCYTALGEKP